MAKATKRGAFNVQLIGPNEIIYPIVRCLKGIPEQNVLAFEYKAYPNPFVKGWYVCNATVRTRSAADALVASVGELPDDDIVVNINPA